MIYPPEHTKRGKRRNAQWLVAVEYLLWPRRREHGLLKALAYANGMTPSRLAQLTSQIRNAKP
jgi:hypothetical protein